MKKEVLYTLNDSQVKKAVLYIAQRKIIDNYRISDINEFYREAKVLAQMLTESVELLDRLIKEVEPKYINACSYSFGYLDIGTKRLMIIWFVEETGEKE